MRNFLRAGFENYDSDGPEDPFDDKSMRTCFVKEALDQTDEEVRALFYGVFQDDFEPLKDVLVTCFTAPRPGKDTLIRESFEKGFKQAPNGLSTKQVGCMLGKLRTAVTDQQLVLISFDETGETAAEVSQKVQDSALQCGVGKTQARASARNLPKF
ncbi:MAG: hypothetical protein ACT4QG_10670 [Sporichthyaceae bacterium]